MATTPTTPSTVKSTTLDETTADLEEATPTQQQDEEAQQQQEQQQERQQEERQLDLELRPSETAPDSTVSTTSATIEGTIHLYWWSAVGYGRKLSKVAGWRHFGDRAFAVVFFLLNFVEVAVIIAICVDWWKKGWIGWSIVQAILSVAGLLLARGPGGARQRIDVIARYIVKTKPNYAVIAAAEILQFALQNGTLLVIYSTVSTTYVFNHPLYIISLILSMIRSSMILAAVIMLKLHISMHKLNWRGNSKRKKCICIILMELALRFAMLILDSVTLACTRVVLFAPVVYLWLTCLFLFIYQGSKNFSYQHRASVVVMYFISLLPCMAAIYHQFIGKHRQRKPTYYGNDPLSFGPIDNENPDHYTTRSRNIPDLDDGSNNQNNNNSSWSYFTSFYSWFVSRPALASAFEVLWATVAFSFFQKLLLQPFGTSKKLITHDKQGNHTGPHDNDNNNNGTPSNSDVNNQAIRNNSVGSIPSIVVEEKEEITNDE